MKGAALLRPRVLACAPTASTDASRISISVPSRSAGTFIAAGVKNILSLCTRNPSPGVQRVSDKEFRKNRSLLLCWAASIPQLRGPTLELLQTSTSDQMEEFASAATCYFGFFFLSLSLHYLPPVLPPFFSSSSPNRGAQ